MTIDQSKWMGLALLPFLMACAETKNLPKKNAVSASFLKAGDCSGDLSLEEGSRGLIHIDALKNYSTGRLEFVGKAFVSEKGLPKALNAYTILGFTARPEKEIKTYNKGVKGKSIAPALEINIGTAATEGQALTSLKPDELSNLRKLSGLSGDNMNSADTSPVLVLQQVPEHPGLYLSSYTNPTSVPLSKLEALTARQNTKLLGGVGPYRSMVLEAKGTGAAAFVLPGDPEPNDDKNYTSAPLKNEKYGDPIVIPIAPDTTAPGDGVESRIIVQLQERSSSPKWIQTCVAGDTSKGAIEIPTKWGEGKDAGEIAAGDAYAIVLRSYRTKSPMPDDSGGEITIETAVGAMAYASIAEKPKDAK